METRRGFFRKLKSAVVGAGAVAAIAAVIPAKPASKETMWWLGKDFKWTGFVPAKDQSMIATNVCKPLTYGDLEKAYNDCMKGGERQPYRIYMNADDYRRGLGYEVG
jgi:hypothetical protein